MSGAKFLAIDIETTGLTWKDSILTVGASWDAPTGIQSQAWSLGMTDLFHAPYSAPLFITELADLCRQAEVIAMHNTVFDLSYLLGHGYLRVEDVKGKIFDTLVTARMTKARNSLSLENLCREYKIGEEWWSKFKGNRKNLRSIDVASVLQYNQIDAENTLHLARILWGESVQLYGEDFTRHESDFCRLMAEVRVRGKKLDQDATVQHWRDLNDKRRELLREVIFPVQIQGPNDRTGLIKYLRMQGYQDHQLSFTDKGNVSVNEDTLEKLAATAKGEVKKVLEAILEVRHIEKITSTYLIPFLEEHADDEFRIHPSYTVGGTTTFRLSSQNPNAQNVPRELNQIIWDQYLSADYSQAELRLAAAYACERPLAEAFHAGKDIHSETALLMFGEVDPDKRKIAKNINFCTLYGGGAKTLEERYHVPYQQGIKFIEKHRKVYPQLHRFTKLAQKKWEEEGYIKLVTGKRIFATRDDLKRAYKAFNNLIQGGVGELVKESMLALDQRGAKIIGQIHDSVEFQVGTVEEATIKEVMETILPEALAKRTHPPIRMRVDVEFKGGNHRE